MRAIAVFVGLLALSSATPVSIMDEAQPTPNVLFEPSTKAEMDEADAYIKAYKAKKPQDKAQTISPLPEPIQPLD